jgi:bifunctional N-acetylglucosamine-1-phosphate-uridyltransferase/glucosamine-1-phosphate-acetyltransferase GlmU-like protein
MNNGVRFASTLNVIIDFDVIFEPGVFVGSGAHVVGKSVVKRNANIGAFSYIKHSTIEQNAKIKSHTVIINSTIAENEIVNSFTQINYQKTVDVIKKTAKKESIFFTGAIKDDIEIDNSHSL